MNIKFSFDSKSDYTCILEKDAVESIEKIEILKNEKVKIYYTITNKYMKKYDLNTKTRVLEIDPTTQNICLSILDAGLYKGE